MEKETFYAYLKEEKEFDNDALYQLKQLVERFPYFQTAKLMLLKNMKDEQHPDFFSVLQEASVVLGVTYRLSLLNTIACLGSLTNTMLPPRPDFISNDSWSLNMLFMVSSIVLLP